MAEGLKELEKSPAGVPPKKLRRPYDAAKTRQAILDAARAAFTDRGFDHVGLREIAAAAGVDAALVIRYFGSKEKLFLAAIGDDFDLLDHWGDDEAKVGERLADRILAARADRKCYDPLLLILRSAPNAKAAKLLKGKLEHDVIEPMTKLLKGENRELRASMLTALLIGLAFTKDVVRADGLKKASTEDRRRLYASLIQSCVSERVTH